MRKISILLSIAIVLVSVFSICPAYAAEPQQLPFEVQSEAVYMENLETGLVMVAKNVDKRLPPASLAKIMTAVLTLENVKDIKNESAYLKMSLNDMIYGTDAKTGGLWPGDELTIEDLLYETLINSAAECALMLADYVSDGSVNHFVEMMNQRATELGCTNTLFTDPHGLDEEQYTTARDMALIAKHAMTLPGFAEIVNTAEYPISALNRDYNFNIYTTNYMLRPSSGYYYAPVMGIKTGTITNARTLATIAKRDGYTYLLVQLGVPLQSPGNTTNATEMISMDEAKLLYEWVFSNFSIRTAVERGEEREEIAVQYSRQGDFVRLATSEQFTALLHNNIDISSIRYVADIPEYLVAPVEKGAEVGQLRLIYMEEEIGSVPLVTTDSLSRSELLAFWGKLGNEIHTFRLKFVIVFTVLIITLYIVLIIRANNLRKRSGKYSSYRSGSDRSYHI